MKYIFSSLLASRADWNAQARVENALLAVLPGGVCVLQRFPHLAACRVAEYFDIAGMFARETDLTLEKKTPQPSKHELRIARM